MNNERMIDLLAYLSALTKLRSLEYRCVDEVDECIDAIRLELRLVSVDKPSIELDGEAVGKAVYPEVMSRSIEEITQSISDGVRLSKRSEDVRK